MTGLPQGGQQQQPHVRPAQWAPVQACVTAAKMNHQVMAGACRLTARHGLLASHNPLMTVKACLTSRMVLERLGQTYRGHCTGQHCSRVLPGALGVQLLRWPCNSCRRNFWRPNLKHSWHRHSCCWLGNSGTPCWLPRGSATRSDTVTKGQKVMSCNVSPLPLDLWLQVWGCIDVLPLWTTACAQITLAAAHGSKA